jgi:hypothetical protein
LTRRLFLCVGGCTAALTLRAAVRGSEAMYVGGTASLPEKTEGELDLNSEDKLVFNSSKGQIEVPYAQITSLEYGQKVGRRVGVAMAVGVLALFSKKRRHFLTIGYADPAGKKQGVVLELAKGTIRSTLTKLEAKSGKQVEFESEEAKKNLGN